MSAPGLLQHRFARLGDGEERDLGEFQGQVLLVVNTASHCGLTPQYAGLQKLHATYRGRGFSVLGFPCNEFGMQEPGSEAQIAAFCSDIYAVDFPLFAKTTVTQGNANPLHRQLGEASGHWPQWNFHKYLISRDGNEVLSFSSATAPDDPQVIAAIERLLAA